MTEFSRSVSFLASDDTIGVNSLIQKRLNIIGYHNTNIEIARFLFSYPVGETFLFTERLNEIIHRLHSAGLHDQWLRKDYAAEVKFRLKIVWESMQKQEQAADNVLQFPFFIVYGWIGGIVVLVIEIIWKKFKISRLMKWLRLRIRKLVN